MKLYISGNRHIQFGTKEEETRILDSTDSSIDVIFEEGRDEDVSDREKTLNLLSAPLTFVSLICYSLVLAFLQWIFTSDNAMQNRLENKTDAEVVKVDFSVHRLVTSARQLWATLNYISLIPLLLFLLADSSSSLLTTSLAYACIVCVLGFIAGTVKARDLAMVLKMNQIAETTDYQTGLLVVGENHQESLKRLLREYSTQIEVVDS